MKDSNNEQVTICEGSFISIWTCGDHPNERWDVHLPDKPFCIPCEVKKLRNHAAAYAELVEAAKAVDNDAVVTTWPDLPAATVSVDKAKWEVLRAALRRVEG